MDGQISKESVFTLSMPAVTNATASSGVNRPRQCITQNFLLIWLDPGIDQSDEDCQNTLAQLRSIINVVHIFTERDECIDFLTEVNDVKIFLIIAGTLGRQILPLIHEIPQLDGVYLFGSKNSSYEQWAKTWVKVKGIHREITPICESIRQAVRQLIHDSIAISFVTLEEVAPSQNLNQLEPSFMYTQLFKEILLEMKHDQNSIKNFIAYCKRGGDGTSANITRFENEYKASLAIWWYTFPSFIHSMLNDALRMLDAVAIINMGFFIRDLHQQIEQLHQKQVSSYRWNPFVVYRGQGLSINDFEKLRKTQGGLMSFNNFLSTSKTLSISYTFAKSVLSKTDTVGILFEMSIDPSISSAPFASIEEVSYFQTEDEILFSMHTVFRIDDIKQIVRSKPLYHVKLTLTSDDDTQLRILTERIREETRGDSGWQKIGTLLLKINQFDKFEELYTALLEKTSDENEKARYYNQFGDAKRDQGDYRRALQYYEKALEIYQNTLPPNQTSLATSYGNIGGVYMLMGEYSKALSFYEKALGIYQNTLPPNQTSLATSYGNIGGVYMLMGEYSKALPFYEKSLEIYQKTLPPNHPYLATSYSNIGSLYEKMGEYSKALSFYKKALEIYEKTLPSNHPDLATSYSNIGAVYKSMREYSKALSSHEKALEIYQKTLPPNHPSLAISYNNIGLVYVNIREYSKALSCYEEALEIYQKTLPSNHPDLATSYSNIGAVYVNMRDYSKALPCYEKELEIYQKSLPPNHPDMATSYNTIGLVYFNMGDYSKALSCYEKALEIYQKTLPSNHRNFAASYNNIATVNYYMKNYSKAFSHFERALNIWQHALLPTDPQLQMARESVEILKKLL